MDSQVIYLLIGALVAAIIFGLIHLWLSERRDKILIETRKLLDDIKARLTGKKPAYDKAIGDALDAANDERLRKYGIDPAFDGLKFDRPGKEGTAIPDVRNGRIVDTATREVLAEPPSRLSSIGSEGPTNPGSSE